MINFPVPAYFQCDEYGRPSFEEGVRKLLSAGDVFDLTTSLEILARDPREVDRNARHADVERVHKDFAIALERAVERK